MFHRYRESLPNVFHKYALRRYSNLLIWHVFKWHHCSQNIGPRWEVSEKMCHNYDCYTFIWATSMYCLMQRWFDWSKWKWAYTQYQIHLSWTIRLKRQTQSHSNLWMRVICWESVGESIKCKWLETLLRRENVFIHTTHLARPWNHILSKCLKPNSRIISAQYCNRRFALLAYMWACVSVCVCVHIYRLAFKQNISIPRSLFLPFPSSPTIVFFVISFLSFCCFVFLFLVPSLSATHFSGQWFHFDWRRFCFSSHIILHILYLIFFLSVDNWSIRDYYETYLNEFDYFDWNKLYHVAKQIPSDYYRTMRSLHIYHLAD